MDAKQKEDWSCVTLLDGAGGAVRQPKGKHEFAAEDIVWAHLQRDSASAQRWLTRERCIPSLVRQALTEMAPWLAARERHMLREVADRITRYVEDLDAGRERASVGHDQLATRLSEQLKRGMYILSVIAAVFLPLSFLTGLFGINVGGLPGADTPWAFASVCVVLALLAAVEVWLLRRLKWI